VEQIVLWGLCDAASAALLYVRHTRDPRIAGMVLLNPWIRSDQSLALTHVKHYYTTRLFQREFWAKLMNGELNMIRALRELSQNVLVASGGGAEKPASQASFQDRMAGALRAFEEPVLLVLSGRDYTAKEFVEYADSNSLWRGLLTRSNIERADLPPADHTFSTASWRNSVEELTLDWARRSFVHRPKHVRTV
jgi:exosortase A-associated hydrolase 1